MSKVICKPCGEVFETNEDYLNHKCVKADGHTPREPEYLVKTTCPNFAKISESALERGKVKKEKKTK